MFPRGFPELFKPTRDLLELRRTEFVRIKIVYETKKKLNDY